MKSILRNIFSSVKKYIPESFRQILKMKASERWSIIEKPENIFETIYHIKDATWEEMEMPEVWELSKRYAFSMYHPQQNILSIPNATICAGSDIVRTDKGIVWDKYDMQIFVYTKPHDGNLTEVNGNSVYLRKPESVTHIDGDCISMLGVYDTLWAHFMMQFLPKLYYAEMAGLLDKKVTVILPECKDLHIRQLVYDILNRHSKCKVIEYKMPCKREEIHVDKLFYIPTAAAVSNDTVFPMLLHQVIPVSVVDMLNEKMVDYYVKQIKDNSKFSEKIYLVRRATFRGLKNYQEVEDFFLSEGFELVEPHLMGWMEKVSLYRNAKIIVGPHSSAWSNAIFCKDAKGLMLTPISWTTDSFVGYNIRKEACNVLMVPGVEDYKTVQSDYYIPLETIKKAYYDLLKR